jgi:hypothetical protein
MVAEVIACVSRARGGVCLCGEIGTEEELRSVRRDEERRGEKGKKQCANKEHSREQQIFSASDLVA